MPFVVGHDITASGRECARPGRQPPAIAPSETHRPAGTVDFAVSRRRPGAGWPCCATRAVEDAMNIGIIGSGTVAQTLGERAADGRPGGHDQLPRPRRAQGPGAARRDPGRPHLGDDQLRPGPPGGGRRLRRRRRLRGGGRQRDGGTASIAALAAAAGPISTARSCSTSPTRSISRRACRRAGSCSSDSLGERIQAAYPDARVVKTLNTMNVARDGAPRPARRGDHVFVAGNDADAKTGCADNVLADWLGWSRIVDLGAITAARGLEMYLPLWLRLLGSPVRRRSTCRWSSPRRAPGVGPPACRCPSGTRRSREPPPCRRPSPE